MCVSRLGRAEEEEFEDRVSDELRSISREGEEEEGGGMTAEKQIRFVTYHISRPREVTQSVDVRTEAVRSPAFSRPSLFRKR